MDSKLPYARHYSHSEYLDLAPEQIVGGLYCCWIMLTVTSIVAGNSIHIGQRGKKVEKPPHHQQLGLKPKTTTNQGWVNGPLMGIKLATNGRWVVAQANWDMANINKEQEMPVYIRP